MFKKEETFLLMEAEMVLLRGRACSLFLQERGAESLVPTCNANISFRFRAEGRRVLERLLLLRKQSQRGRRGVLW